MAWFAFLAAYFVLRDDMRRRGLPGDPMNVILTLVVAGLAGSKLYHVLEQPRELFADPIGMLFSSYGFAWFGGFLGGVIALIIMARHLRIPMLEMLDASSPAAALGYAIGRIGCLLSGDGDYGIPTTLPWGMKFHLLDESCRLHHFICVARGALEPSTALNLLHVPSNEILPVHPTPIYEFIVGVLIAIYLWKRGTRFIREHRPIGLLLAEYLVLTGLARFLVEFIRINPRSFLGMTNAQVVSLLSILAGIALMIFNRQAHQERQVVTARKKKVSS
jgi:phosphatidylglycerol:prolipoprotein diacylglycerol transferase